MRKVHIEQMNFSEGEYCCGNQIWKTSTLHSFAKEKKYPEFDLPLVAVNLSVIGFESKNLKDFIFQCKRVRDCSLTYPILLDDHGVIADGYHRVCKAILEGKKTIRAIRLEEMPPSFTRTDTEEE